MPSHTGPARVAVAVSLALGGFAVVPPAAPAAGTTGPIARVYVSLPRVGDGAPSAAKIATGLRAALRLHGATAGRHRIRFVWMNDARGARWAPDLVVANARRAAADPRAIAYVGEGNSGATALAMPIINRAGLTHLSPVSTATALTADAFRAEYQPTGVQTFFRPFPNDDRQSVALLASVVRAKAGRRVVLVDDDGLYGRGLTAGFESRARAAGVTVLRRRVADADGRGVVAMARQVARDRPTAIVYGGAPSSGAARVVRVLHRKAPRAVIFGGDALAHDAFARKIGRAGAVVRLTTPAAHVDPRTKAAKALGSRPDVFTVFAHNGMTALLRAVDRAGRTRAGVDRESVRRAVFSGRLQPGLSGHWSISPTGDADYGVYDALRIANRRIVTPVDDALAKMLRDARRPGTRQLRGAGPSSPPVPASTIGTNGISMQLIQSMDIETALMMVQSERTKLLDAQLQLQIQEVQNRNEQVARLNNVLNALNQTASLVRGTDATSTSAGSDPAKLASTWSTLLETTEKAAMTGLGLPMSPEVFTKSAIESAITKVKSAIDAAGNSQQMDMLRLQSMSNKRNEAFDVMTNFVKRMQESRSSIIGNMR